MAKVIISTDSGEVMAVVHIDMVHWVNLTNKKTILLEVREWLDHIYDYRLDQENIGE